MASSNIILLAHGSRDKNWCEVFEKGLSVINSNLPEKASLAYMEMASPSLEQVVTSLYCAGKKQIIVLPLFFAAGRHLQADVPIIIQSLKDELDGLEIHLYEALGHKNEFWEFLAELLAVKIKALT